MKFKSYIAAATATIAFTGATAHAGGNLLVNGNFDAGDDNSGLDGWTVEVPSGGWFKAKQGNTSIMSGSLNVGTYACWLQMKQNNWTESSRDSIVWQTISVTEPGTYECSLKAAFRAGYPGNNPRGVPFRIDLVYPDNTTAAILDAAAPSSGTSFTSYSSLVELTEPGTYTFKLVQSAFDIGNNGTAANIYDNLSFSCVAPYEYPAGNLIKNGTFDAGNAIGDVLNNGATIPFWNTTNPAQTGKAPSNSYWVRKINDVGRFALFYQRNKESAHTIYQDFTVPEAGLYKISFRYGDRSNYDPGGTNKGGDYDGIPFELQLVCGGETTTVYSQTAAFTDDTLHEWRGYVTLAATDYRLQFYIPSYTLDGDKGTGDIFDDVVILKAGVATAEWTGGGLADDLSDPDNWLCKDGEGNTMPGCLPDDTTDTLYFKGLFAVNIPAGSTLKGAAIVFSDGATLSGSCDWSGVSLPMSGTLDINGKSFTIKSLFTSGEITDGSANTSAPGELHLNVASGTLNNSQIALSGNLKLVKEGAGIFVSSRQQTYTGGTLVAGGTAQPPDGSGANATYSGMKFKAFGTGQITAGTGGTFDIRGNYDFNAEHGSAINLAGGTFANYGAAMSQKSWGKSGVGSLATDSYMAIESNGGSGNETLFGGQTVDLGTHTLTARVARGRTLALYAGFANGTFAVRGKGWVGFGADIDMKNATFDVGAIISLGEHTVEVKDYIVNYTGTGDNSEKETAGLGALNVYGTFRPNYDYFYGCTMMDGSTIDLSGRTAPLPAETAFTREAASLLREISYQTGAINVTVKLDGRSDLRQLATSTDADTGASNGYVMYWNSMPAANFVLDAGADSGKYELAKDATGLKLIPRRGFTIRVAGLTDSITIPSDWMLTNAGVAFDASDDDALAAVQRIGANGLPLWQSWCLGLVPGNAASVVLCEAADDVTAAGAVSIKVKNLEVPETLGADVRVMAYLDRKTSAADWTPVGEGVRVPAGNGVTLNGGLAGNECSFYRVRIQIQ